MELSLHLKVNILKTVTMEWYANPQPAVSASHMDMSADPLLIKLPPNHLGK